MARSPPYHGVVWPSLQDHPFARATVVNFFFWAALNGFVLLPIYVQQLGGTEIEIGLVMGIYSGVGIVLQPVIGPWVDAIGRKPFMDRHARPARGHRAVDVHPGRRQRAARRAGGRVRAHRVAAGRSVPRDGAASARTRVDDTAILWRHRGVVDQPGTGGIA